LLLQNNNINNNGGFFSAELEMCKVATLRRISSQGAYKNAMPGVAAKLAHAHFINRAQGKTINHHPTALGESVKANALFAPLRLG